LIALPRWLRTLLLLLLAGAIGAALLYALWPKPVPVEWARASRGPMRVTVDEDGNTRIRERYLVSAPLAGRLARITLEEGDAVAAGETVVAAIDPTDPTLLDPRARAEAEARVRAAEAALEQAGAAVIRANAALELAQTESERLREASAQSAVAPLELDRAEATESIRLEEAREAEFAREMARFELELARAAMVRGEDGESEADWRFEIRAPVDGSVLRVLQESAAVVVPGTPLIEIGDPTDLELVVDVLSCDAVALRPGAAASLEQWGGGAPLAGRVRLVEPAAFTKISALGVEEQRVNVIIDFVDPPAAREGLGDGYRIEARITVWDQSDVLTIPTGALFRQPDSWAVYAVVEGRAQLRPVEIGHRNGAQAEVLAGLQPDGAVVVYPSDRVRHGVRVVERER
jgi:HlyD family secretion protein